MTRYFFDLVGHSRSIYDFHGRQFSEALKAQEQAQLLAFGLEVEEDEDFIGGFVHLRDAKGAVVFSAAIRAPEQRAA